MSSVPVMVSVAIPGDAVVVCFPLPVDHGRPVRRGLRRLASLAERLPGRWRRRVVIGGVQFWTPR